MSPPDEARRLPGVAQKRAPRRVAAVKSLMKLKNVYIRHVVPALGRNSRPPAGCVAGGGVMPRPGSAWGVGRRRARALS